MEENINNTTYCSYCKEKINPEDVSIRYKNDYYHVDCWQQLRLFNFGDPFGDNLGLEDEE